ncbi:MFS transporter [Metabacillus litoralis]|uniref:MFS transporter n=1 Tax=Metabacillus litoralis TaxID=152268 RepID=UPI00288A4ACF|nr:MFS transporter [Metabacillus litoralis]
MKDLAQSKKRILICLILCSFWVGLDLLIISPLIPSISTSLGFSIDAGGFMIASYAIVYAFSAPVFGPLSDKWGRKRLIMCGLFTFSLGAFLTITSNSLPTLLLFRGLSGIGAAMIMPSVYALVGDTFEYVNRGKVMGLVTGAMGGASVLGIPLGSFIVYSTSWQLPFLIIGLFALVILIASYFYIPIDLNNNEKMASNSIVSSRDLFSKVYKSKTILFTLICTLLWWAGFQGMFANMGSYYTSNYSLNIMIVGLVFSFTGLGNVLGNIFGGRASDIIGKRRAIVYCCIFSAIAVLVISTIKGNLFLVIAVHFLWSVLTGFGQASLTSFVSELKAEIRGTVLSLNSSATYMGMAITTTASTFILEKSEFQLLGMVCAVAYVLIFPIMTVLVKDNDPQPPMVVKISKV